MARDEASGSLVDLRRNRLATAMATSAAKAVASSQEMETSRAELERLGIDPDEVIRELERIGVGPDQIKPD
jgi:hypothetical protein